MQVQQHPLATLAVGATNVMNSRHASLDHNKRVATLDDKMAGNMLANEVIAICRASVNRWADYALKVATLTSEGREQFMKALKADKTALTKDATAFGIDKKVASARTRSYGVQLSNLAAVAKAFNAGGTIDGLLEYMWSTSGKPMLGNGNRNIPTVDNVGFTVWVEYARTFGKSKAGRPTKSWAEKLAKFLEDNPADGEDNTPMETKAYSAIVEIVNAIK